MIKALVTNGDKSADIRIPSLPFYLKMSLNNIGIVKQVEDIKINDAESNEIQVKIHSDSEFDNCIIALFNKNHSLYDINNFVTKLKNSKPQIQKYIEDTVMNGQYNSPNTLLDEIDKKTDELVKVKIDYYCPLQAYIEDEEDGFRDIAEDECIWWNEEKIRKNLLELQTEELDNMALYYDGNESLSEKLVSAIWDIEEINGMVYGVVHTYLTEELTPEEEQDWIRELIGQASNGLGEVFEQREIQTDDGVIYIAFWNDSEDYFMENETEFQNRIAEEHGIGMQIGEM